MIDRPARTQMAKAIRAFMAEETTAFQFDEKLSEIRAGTEDPTIATVGSALWFHYDDCQDHKVVLSKDEWDYFNRLLLLLESDAEIKSGASIRRWCPTQAVAAVLLVLFLVIAAPTGLGKHLLIYAMPFGPPSMLLSWLKTRRQRKEYLKSEAPLAPFPSLSSLRAARRSVKGFVRKHYSNAVAGRRVRDPITEKILLLPWALCWCAFSPVALLFQMLPEREFQTDITFPQPPTTPSATT